MKYVHVDAEFGTELIDMMNSSDNRSSEWVDYYSLLSDRSRNKHLDNVQAVHLVKPSNDITQTIVDNGGYVVDSDDDGYLFCVPRFWVVDGYKHLNANVFGRDGAYINMIIPTPKPTVIYSVMSANNKSFDDGHVFRYWQTHMLESKVTF